MKFNEYGQWYLLWYYQHNSTELILKYIKATPPLTLKTINQYLPSNWKCFFVDLYINSVRQHKNDATNLELKRWFYIEEYNQKLIEDGLATSIKYVDVKQQTAISHFFPGHWSEEKVYEFILKLGVNKGGSFIVEVNYLSQLESVSSTKFLEFKP